MAQSIFGSGFAWFTPQVDAAGNKILEPTPVILGALQEVSLDVSFETAKLYTSQSQAPAAIARSKMNIGGKAKFKYINGDVLNSIIFGAVNSNGLVSVSNDTVSEIVPIGLSVTVDIPYDGDFYKDLGCHYSSNAMQLRRVASAPDLGEYTLDEATGTYSFNAADEGKEVYFTFSYKAEVAGAKKSTIGKQKMGLTPTFSIDIYLPYEAEGQSTLIHLYKCTTDKFSFSSKQADFTDFDIDFTAFADTQGRLLDISTTE